MNSRRVMVMALDDQGATRAIGPVVRDESIERIRGEIEARGWTAYGQALMQSVADWRAECRQMREGTVNR